MAVEDDLPPEDDEEIQGQGGADEGQGEEGDDGAGLEGSDEGEVPDGEEGDADENEGEEAGTLPQVAPKGRAAARIQALREETRKANRRAEDAERAAQEALRLVQQAPQAPKETPQQRAERFALMSPAEVIEERIREEREQFGSALRNMQFQLQDTSDRTVFEGLCSREPALAKVRDEVERVLAEERRKGNNPSREAIANYMLGKMAREKAARAAGKQGKQAQAGRQRQAAAPTRSRGDVAPERRGGNDTAEARRKRLENVVF